MSVSGADEWGFYEYDVDLFRPDAVEVSVSIANGTTTPSHGNPVTVSSVTLPITVDQLLALAESDLWN